MDLVGYRSQDPDKLEKQVTLVRGIKTGKSTGMDESSWSGDN